MPNLVGIGNSQVPTNAMLGGMAYQEPSQVVLGSLEPGNISKIKTKLSSAAEINGGSYSSSIESYDLFVYDTSYDTDGGAWRYKCQGTSWYNEDLGTNIRGTRRDFPSLAIIKVYSTNVCVIYDGDDPNCPMWMKTEFVMGSGNNTCVCAMNGMLVMGASNNGILEMDFVADTVRVRNHAHLHTYNQGIFPVRQSRTAYESLTEDSGVIFGSDPSILNEYINDVAICVEPTACVDPARQNLPLPTIGVASGNNNGGGVSIIRGTIPRSQGHNVINRDMNNTYSVHQIEFTTDGRSYYYNTDYTPSLGHANMLKWSAITDNLGNNVSGGLSDFYSTDRAGNTNIGLLAMSNWILTRSDTAHDEVWKYWGHYWNGGGGNAIFNEVVAWDDFQGAVGHYWRGFTQWQLFNDPRMAWSQGSGTGYGSEPFSSNGILVNSVTDTFNTGWHPARTVHNYINADTTAGTINTGSSIQDHGPWQQSLTTAGGSFTSEPVNTGCELNCVSGFASNVTMQKSSPSFNNYGDGTTVQLCLMGWVKIASATSYSYLCSVYDSNSSDVAGIAIHTSGSRKGQVYAYDTREGAIYSGPDGNTLQTVDNNQWHHVCCVWSGSGAIEGRGKSLYINGKLVAFSNASSIDNLNLSGVTHVTVGAFYNGSFQHTMDGRVTLVKVVNGKPTEAQINKIYHEEREMFEEGAQITIHGNPSPCDVRGMDFDRSTGLLHVGTVVGRSDFRKLIRINNTTNPMTDYDHQIAAGGGLVVEDTTK